MKKNPVIKFSHSYHKLRKLHGRKTAILLAAIPTDFSKLGVQFRAEDTMYFDGEQRFYTLPKRGKCILLIFKAFAGLFTTVRPAWPSWKYTYYEKNVGNIFDVLIEE